MPSSETKLSLTSPLKLLAHLIYEGVEKLEMFFLQQHTRLGESTKTQASNLARPTSIQVKAFLHALKT